MKQKPSATYSDMVSESYQVIQGPHAALIAAIVDRDTPPDSRDDVIDHDIRGNPIRRRDLDRFVKPVASQFFHAQDLLF